MKSLTNWSRGIGLIVCLLTFSYTHAQRTYIVGESDPTNGGSEVTIILLERDNDESIPGTTVYIESLEFGAIADLEGKVVLNLTNKQYLVRVDNVGFESIPFILDVRGNGTLTLKMRPAVTELMEIVIEADPDANVTSTQIGKNTLSIEAIEGLPQFVGEVDILKSIVLLPGISTVGEASSGFNVRGGGFDQNLILLGGAPLYNPSHLFGFFSAFNSDFIDEVNVFKGGIPARYGGRSSSILDLTYKSGNYSKWSSKLTTGLISTKLKAEGPIIRDKLSVLLGGRISYSNWILKAVKSPEVSNSSADFYDVNAIVDYKINDTNRLKYSYYRSMDDFQLLSDTTFNWANQQHVLTYSGQVTDKLFLKASGVSSEYSYNIVSDFNLSAFDLGAKIMDRSGKIEANISIAEENDIYFGLEARQYQISPGELKPGPSTGINPVVLDTEKGAEYSVFVQHDLPISSKFGISYGLRYSMFNFLGPNSVNEYEPFLPLAEENINQQTFFGNNEVIQSYDGFEPRLALRFTLNPTTSIKLGYNRMNQYIHLISNTTTIAPTDTWKLSDPFVKPQIASQYSAGFFKNFLNNQIETSIEAFYKDMLNVIEYKDGAVLILNNNPETELLNGKGYAYGLELYAKRKSGRMTGWISYTYSRSLRQVNGPYPEEQVNQGDVYPSNFDKPHDLTATMEYKLTPYTKLSSIFTYSIGRPVTYPSAKFRYLGEDISYYDSRNQNRAPVYSRLDASLTFQLRGRSNFSRGEIVFSVYNILGRKNAFSVFFDDLPGQPPQAYKLSIIGVPFPSLSYSFNPF